MPEHYTLQCGGCGAVNNDVPIPDGWNCTMEHCDNCGDSQYFRVPDDKVSA